MRNRFAIIALTALIVAPPTASASSEQEDRTVVAMISGTPIYEDDPAWQEYWWQREHGGPGIEYWTIVAQCENRQIWDRRGTWWSGGLGIYTRGRFTDRDSGTWERWGGEMFAPRPNGATPLQQIVVANRIAMFGFRATYRQWNGKHMRVVQAQMTKRPVGFNGWGCIKQNRGHQRSINPARFERRRPKEMLTYQVFNLIVPLKVPDYAYRKVPHRYLR